MNLLDRYIFTQFVFHFILILFSLIMIYLLVDFFERIDKFHGQGVPAHLAIRYFIMKIPFIYDQIAPFCLELAGIITLGLLMNHRELQTLNASGISTLRVIRPLLAAAFILTFVSLAAAQWLVPYSGSEVHRIWHEKVLGKRASGIVRNGRIFFRGQSGFYTFKQTGQDSDHFTDFRYLTLDKNGRQKMLLYAATAAWDGTLWQLTDAQIKKNKTDGSFSIKPYKKVSLALPDKPSDFFKPAVLPTEQSLTQMVRQAFTGNQARNRQSIVNVNRRFSSLFLGLPLLILAIPIVLSLHNNQSGINLSVAIPASMSLAFLAWTCWSILQAMAQAGSLNPAAASWSVHLLATGTGLLMLQRQTY